MYVFKRLLPMIFVANSALGQIAPTTSAFGLQDRSSGLGLSRDYNPAIGANILIGAEYISEEATNTSWPQAIREAAGKTGLFFQEAEISFAGAVDPYLRADLTVALHHHQDEFHVEVEEGYVTTLFIPRVTLRAGKFYQPFGKHNVLHTHAFPFIDAPVSNITLFGHEGLNEVAAEAALLLPLPFFAEVTAYVADGKNGMLFHSERSEDLAYGGRAHFMLELGDSLTMHFGGSYVSGKNVAGGFSHVFGGDFTLRWIPLGRERYQQVVWQSEYVHFRRTGPRPQSEGTPEENGSHEHADAQSLLAMQAGLPSGLGGFYSLFAAKIAQRWWIGARLDGLGYPKGENGQRLHRASGMLAFVPSEYSALRLQYSYFHEGRVHQILFQINVSFGAHPAHAY